MGGRGPGSSNGNDDAAELEKERVRKKLRASLKKAGAASIPCPTEFRKLRACMICSLIKAKDEFEHDGCDNCKPLLVFAKLKGSCDSYTSTEFEGMIGLMQPKDSWVAKWQRIAHLKPGVYAVNVSGEVTDDVKKALANAGHVYVSRDKAAKKELNMESLTIEDEDEDPEHENDSNDANGTNEEHGGSGSPLQETEAGIEQDDFIVDDNDDDGATVVRG